METLDIPQIKVKLIGELKGAPKEELFDFLNKNFRTGPGLAESIAKYVSKGRPRGATSDSVKGILKRIKK